MGINKASDYWDYDEDGHLWGMQINRPNHEAHGDFRSFGFFLLEAYAKQNNSMAGLCRFLGLQGMVATEDMHALLADEKFPGKYLTLHLAVRLAGERGTYREIAHAGLAGHWHNGDDEQVEITGEQHRSLMQQAMLQIDPNDPNRLGWMLKSARLYNGLTQEETGARTNIDRRKLGTYEAGAMPRHGKIIVDLSEALHVPDPAKHVMLAWCAYTRALLTEHVKTEEIDAFAARPGIAGIVGAEDISALMRAEKIAGSNLAHYLTKELSGSMLRLKTGIRNFSDLDKTIPQVEIPVALHLPPPAVPKRKPEPQPVGEEAARLRHERWEQEADIQVLQTGHPFGMVLHGHRKAHGLTCREAARRLEVHPDVYLSWETGERNPLLPNMRKLADLYGLFEEKRDTFFTQRYDQLLHALPLEAQDAFNKQFLVKAHAHGGDISNKETLGFLSRYREAALKARESLGPEGGV